jgi:cobyrinic acid a,c-diamide synthase
MPELSIPRIVISGLRGGGGKTILALALLSSWHDQRKKIIPFKKGPDYIDAGWLARASGSPCYNLDLFMMSPEQAVYSFITHGKDSELALIEGNRGLYDGVNHEGTYSTGELAKLLKAPVLLVVDCTKVTNTLAAMVLGCQKMDPDVHIGGVVLNRVATDRQEALLRKSLEKNCNLPVLGAIPRLKKDPFPERHMGLVPFQEHEKMQRSIKTAAEIGSRYLDLEGILRLSCNAEHLSYGEIVSPVSDTPHIFPRGSATQDSQLAIGVMRDSAFQFYYEENLEALRARGVRIVDVSPLRDMTIPDMDALYIGGGFPETHAIPLSENLDFKNSIIRAVDQGLPVYAECGGFMYLGRKLIRENKTYPMAGVLPVSFCLEKKPQAHGYTTVEVSHDNPYFPRGCALKGHEFHYSRAIELDLRKAYMTFTMNRGHGIHDGKDGLCYNSVLATYTHLHVLGAPEWADGIIKCAQKYKKQKKGAKGSRSQGVR